MTIFRRLTVAVLSFALLPLVVGCSSSPRAEGKDVTGGLALRLFVKLDEDSYAAYRLDADGTLSFAGGQDALDREYSWSGPMTEEEIASLLALIETHGWLEADPESTYVPPQRSFEIRLARSGGKKRARRFEVIGSGPGVGEVYDLLETAARRRHEEFLRTLPQPGFPES